MPAPYYRLPLVFAATVSLALAACGGVPEALRPAPMPPAGAQPAAKAPAPPQTAANTQGDIDTDATIWTVLGLADERKAPPPGGPLIGAGVSPILWQAAHDTLGFVKIETEDPMSGRMVTAWYSPPGKPNERFRAAVFILSRALRSDAVVVRVQRQAQTGGAWQDSGVDKKVNDDLAFTILRRAREIRQIIAERPK